MDPLKSKVAFTALYSRLAIWAVSALANLLIPDHDAGVFLWTRSPDPSVPTRCDVIVSYLCDGLTRWDGQYFLHIANNGYTYENTMAFFPMYPILVRFTAEVLYWMQVDYDLMHFHSTLKLAGTLVNMGLFVMAALVLYDLSRRVLKDEYLAYKSALYFSINPASVFFSATYSEALHAFLSFSIMARVEKNFSFKLGLFLALSSATRSNGILNFGFMAYKAAKVFLFEIGQYRKLMTIGKEDLSTTVANILGDSLVPLFFCGVITAMPFGVFQWYGFTQFCSLTRPNLTFAQNIIDYAHNHSLKLPSKDPSPWCSEAVPISYSYIQNHYWEVGLLKYFTLRQVPNFVLAAPILYVTLKNAAYFFRRHKSYSMRLGLELHQQTFSNPSIGDLYHLKVLPRECLVYVVHVTFLAIFSLTCMHVQVATRLLASSSPCLYWWVSILTIPKNRKPVPLVEYQKSAPLGGTGKVEKQINLEKIFSTVISDERPQLSVSEKWMQNYFLGYAFVGTVLFSNFLPWT